MARKPNPSAADRTTMTVAIGAAEKKQLKLYAIEEGMTVSDVVSTWVRHYCGGQSRVPLPKDPDCGAASCEDEEGADGA